MEPFTDIAKALTFISQYNGSVSNFLLPLSNSLLDPLGVHMSVIMDEILNKGWLPDGFEEHDGYRIYKCKEMDNG